MKRVLCWLLLASVLLLCACGSDDEKKAKSKKATEAVPENEAVFELDDQTIPTGETELPTENQYAVPLYGELPDNYTEEQALADQCLVLSWPEGEITPNISGIENWEAFLELVENDAKEARIRAVYFQNGIYYHTDLTYIDGYFSMYTLNVFQNYEKAIGTYPYIKRIEGVEPNTDNLVCYYVLSELELLTSEDVLSAQRICDIETERGVPYEPIPFTQYFTSDKVRR